LADHHAVQDSHDSMVIGAVVGGPFVNVFVGVLDALLQEPAGYVGPMPPRQELLGECSGGRVS